MDYPYRTIRRSGFTIVELLIVIVVIGILAAISIVAYGGIQNRAVATVLQSDLRNAATQLSIKQVEDGSYPNPNLPSDVSGSSDTTFHYTSDGTDYCLTAISSRSGVASYHVSSTGAVAEGSCPGHPSGGGEVALDCPTGFIVVPGNSSFGTSDFCVMKYEAKNVGGVATSQAAGTPWVSISQTSAITIAQAACDGCQLITEAQWMTIAANVLGVDSNWSGGSVGSGAIYNGHNDNNPANALAASDTDSDGYFGTGNGGSSNQRRTLTLTNGEVIWDFAGNVFEWTQGTIAGGQQPGLAGESAFAWKQWHNGSLQWGGLPSSSRPSAISGTVAGYGTAEGIGQLYSNLGEASARAFMRGGYWQSGSSNAGILTLNLSRLPGNTNGTITGFRVSQ